MRATILAIVAAVAAGHLCALSPLQWGGVYGADVVAAAECFETSGPCPSSVKPDPIASQAYQGGSKATIVMLKNADHFAGTASPGNFSVALWNPAGQATFLGSIPDSALPALTTYSVDVLIPKVQSGNYTIQTIYYTNNPAAPAAFYQCSTVFIL